MRRRDLLCAVAALSAAPLALLATPATGARGAVVALTLDTTELKAQLSELRSLLLEAGNITEGVLSDLRHLVENEVLWDEVIFVSGSTARAANQAVLFARFKTGGVYDRIRTAAGALRLNGQS